MKKLLIILLVIAAIGGIGYVAATKMMATEREMAKNFVILSTTGEHQQAFDMFHPALKQQFPLERFEQFNNVHPYVDVSFSSMQMAEGATTLKGSASTADGCASQVAFKIVGEQIVSFNINPLCFK